MSAPALAEWLESFRDLANEVRDRAYGDTSYGVCTVDDPRKFTPDPECVTDSELAAWRSDCERAERGEARQTETTCAVIDVGNGAIAHVMRSGYGLGVSVIDGDPELAELSDRLDVLLSQIEAWSEDRANELEPEVQT